MTKRKRPSIDDYMTIPEAVDSLDIPKATIYYWMKIKQLPCDKIGKTKVVLRKDVLALQSPIS
jgi:hypothetical protein